MCFDFKLTNQQIIKLQLTLDVQFSPNRLYHISSSDVNFKMSHSCESEGWEAISVVLQRYK